MYLVHPNFELPNIDTRIIRYFILPKYLNLLQSRSLFMCRADRFIDKAEGIFTDREWATWLTVSSRNGMPLDQAIIGLNSWTDRKKFIYINCWNISNYPSSKMWIEYAGSMGIAVLASIDNLIMSLRKTKDKVFIGSVKYLDYNKDFLANRGGFYSPFLCKKDKYSYENEIRIIHDYGNSRNWTSIITPDFPDPGFFIRVDLNKLIHKIYIHPDSPTWYLDVIKNINKTYGLKVGVEFAKLELSS